MRVASYFGDWGETLVDAAALVEARKAYGTSWKNRGGIGAFMVLARKWDRIETQCNQVNYDIFHGCVKFSGDDGLLDDIRDLRRYLLLVEEDLMATGKIPDLRIKSLQEEIDEGSVKIYPDTGEATSGYVNQD